MHQPPPSMKMEYGQAAGQVDFGQKVEHDGEYGGDTEKNSSSTDGSGSKPYSPTKPTTTPTKVEQCPEMVNKGKLNMHRSRKKCITAQNVQLLCIHERLLMDLLKFSQQNVNIHHRHQPFQVQA